jgi:hypothetical protein
VQRRVNRAWVVLNWSRMSTTICRRKIAIELEGVAQGAVLKQLVVQYSLPSVLELSTNMILASNLNTLARASTAAARPRRPLPLALPL